MTARDEFLREFRSHLGYREPGNGSTRFGEWYAKRVGDSSFATGAWCDMLVSYCGVKVAAGDSVGVFAYTVAHAKWFRDRGEFNRTPRPGAIVFFDWSGSRDIDKVDHVGVVESVRANGDLVTLEGNTDDRVMRRVRSMNTVVGFGHPWGKPRGDRPAKAASRPPKGRRRKWRVVATTRFGGRRLIFRNGGGFSFRKGRARLTAGEVEAAKKWARRRAVRDVRAVPIGEFTHLSRAAGVEWPTDRRLLRVLNKVGRRRGRLVVIQSGRRTMAQQWDLWRIFQAGGNLAAYPNERAPHVRGVAADVGILDRRGVYRSLRLDSKADKIARGLGASARIPSEAWHYQMNDTY